MCRNVACADAPFAPSVVVEAVECARRYIVFGISNEYVAGFGVNCYAVGNSDAFVSTISDKVLANKLFCAYVYNAISDGVL